MNISITVDVDDNDLALLPTGAVPSVEPLSQDKRNNVFDMGTMEAKFDEYKSHSEALKTIHKEWHDAYTVWGKRLDVVFGKVSAIDNSAAVVLGKEPGSDYEPFEVLSLPNIATTTAAVIGFGSSVYSAYKAKQAYATASAAYQGATGAARAAALTDLRWAKFQGGVAVAGMLLSGYVAYRTVSDRTEFLMNSLPSLAEWFEEGAAQIEVMRTQTTTFIAEIREIAQLLTVDDPDNNTMYRNVVAALNAAMTDAAEVEAQYKVATRMLCPISTRTPVQYNVIQTATATGLPETVVQTRFNEIAEDEENICAPYRPAS